MEKIFPFSPLMECPFANSCTRIGGPNSCQLDTAVEAFLKRSQFEVPILEDLDALLGNRGYQQCPYFFEISSSALDRIKDPARYRRLYTTISPRKIR